MLDKATSPAFRDAAQLAADRSRHLPGCNFEGTARNRSAAKDVLVFDREMEFHALVTPKRLDLRLATSMRRSNPRNRLSCGVSATEGAYGEELGLTRIGLYASIATVGNYGEVFF